MGMELKPETEEAIRIALGEKYEIGNLEFVPCYILFNACPEEHKEEVFMWINHTETDVNVAQSFREYKQLRHELV